MTPERDDRHREGVGAYVLGALPELEQQAFERHVMGCPDCRDEIERLRPAVDALPRSVTPISAPPRVKRALLAEVAREASTRAKHRAAGEGEQRPRGALSGLGVRVRRWITPAFRRARPATAWVAAAFLLAVGIVAGYGGTQLLDPSEDQRYAAAFDERRLVEGSGTLLVPEDSDNAVLSVHGVPSLPSRRQDEIYQLWLVRGNEVIPSSLLTVGSDGSGTAAIPEGVNDADAVWVTREEVGGVAAPTEKPVMEIDLS
jgi:anti-sigma-K factor RskA